MGKPNRKGRSTTGGKFVKLDGWMLKSPAYRSLSPAARALLVEFLNLYNGANNGDLFMSQRDAAAAVGIRSYPTAAKYLRELEEKGFVRTRIPGSFSNKTHQATCYILTMVPYRDKGPSKDFMHWQPSDEEKRRIEKLTPAWMQRASAGKKSIPVDWPDANVFPSRDTRAEATSVGDNPPI